MNDDLVLGVDIGIRGAVALISRSGELVALEDMPCLNDGPAGRRNVNAALLAEIVFKAHAALAFVEHVLCEATRRRRGRVCIRPLSRRHRGGFGRCRRSC